MDKREELKKMILDVMTLDCIDNGEFIEAKVNVDEIVEHLIRKNVFVSPVGVGDNVYVLSHGNIVPMKVDVIQYSSTGCKILGRNERFWGYGTITLSVDNSTGVEWYTSRKDAENALKEHDENKDIHYGENI